MKSVMQRVRRPRRPPAAHRAGGATWAALVLLAAATAHAAEAAAPAHAAAVVPERVAAIALTVGDMERALPFYTTVLRFRKISDVEVWGDDVEHLDGLFGIRKRIVQLRLGDETLVLTDYLTAGGRPVPPDSRSNDAWFQHVALVVRDMDEAYAWLRAHRVVHASTGPQRLPDWNPNAGGIEAFYFRDPDDHNLEIIWFPAGKGDPKWQAAAQAGGGAHGTAPGDGLFLGIDHTAIVVRDTEASTKFYSEWLGMRVTGHSENFGPEQEHLNNVFGARLWITGLRAAAGPGIEFLEYRAPRDGRPAPGGLRADDLIHWHTTLVVQDVPAAAARLQQAGASFVSPGTVAVRGDILGFEQAFRVRDPDGHVLEVTDSWRSPPGAAGTPETVRRGGSK